MKKWIYIFVFMLTLVSRSHAGPINDWDIQMDVDYKNPIQDAAKLVVMLAWDRIDPYYGTGFMIDVDDEYYYFATVGHILPLKHPTDFTIQAIGPVKGYEPVEIYIIGEDPRYDTGFFKVARAPGDKADINELRELINTMILWGELDTKDYHVAVIGTPTYTLEDRAIVHNRLWEEDMEAWSSWNPPDPTKELLIDIALSNTQLSLGTLNLPLKDECPQTLPMQCYHYDASIWGHSGSPTLFGESSIVTNKWVKLFGMVSHYSPHAETTWVIPNTVIRKSFEKVSALYEEHGRPILADLYIRWTDDNEMFELISKDEVKILTGPMAQMTLRRPKGPLARNGGGPSTPAGESAGGGKPAAQAGESAGGGNTANPAGESTGGGEDADGGGGPKSRQQDLMYLVLDKRDSQTALASWDALAKQIEHPEFWGEPNHHLTMLMTDHLFLRGTEALLSYVPGIELEGKIIYQMGDMVIPTPQSFLTAYQKEPQKVGALYDAYLRSLKEPPEKKFKFAHEHTTKLPRHLTLTKRVGNGLQTAGNIIKLTPHKQLIAVPELRRIEFMVGGDELILSEINSHFLFHGKSLDVISMRDVLEPQTITKASVDRKLGRIVISGVSPRSGKFVFSFSELDFVPKGPHFYQYRGKVTYRHAPGFDSHLPDISGSTYGVVTLQYDTEHKRYELKAVLAFLFSTKEVEGVNDIMTHMMNCEAFYIPLEPTEKAVKIEMTPEELVKLQLFFFESKQIMEGDKELGDHPLITDKRRLLGDLPKEERKRLTKKRKEAILLDMVRRNWITEEQLRLEYKDFPKDAQASSGFPSYRHLEEEMIREQKIWAAQHAN